MTLPCTTHLDSKEILVIPDNFLDTYFQSILVWILEMSGVSLATLLFLVFSVFKGTQSGKPIWNGPLAAFLTQSAHSTRRSGSKQFCATNHFSRSKIAEAIDEYKKKTCIDFAPKSAADQDYIHIVPDDGCYSLVGRIGKFCCLDHFQKRIPNLSPFTVSGAFA